jgi:hypothetical protein
MLFVVVAGAGLGLVFSAPVQPGEDVGDGMQGAWQECVEESSKFVDDRNDQCCGGGGGAAFGGGGDGQEGMRKHR